MSTTFSYDTRLNGKSFIHLTPSHPNFFYMLMLYVYTRPLSIVFVVRHRFGLWLPYAATTLEVKRINGNNSDFLQVFSSIVVLYSYVAICICIQVHHLHVYTNLTFFFFFFFITDLRVAFKSNFNIFNSKPIRICNRILDTYLHAKTMHYIYIYIHAFHEISQIRYTFRTRFLTYLGYKLYLTYVLSIFFFYSV